ncbi:MAG: DUF4198 domain-containing protein [Pseudomonadota bacterium]
MRAAELAFLGGIVLATPLTAHGHEMWLEPKAFTLGAGEKLVADIIVGDDFTGTTYSYQPRNLTRFEIFEDGEVRGLASETGQKPAVSEASLTEGLTVLIYHSATLVTAYRSFEKFERFLAQKGIEWAAETHRERGLPNERFREAYSRYSKSLIGVGDADGQDRSFDLLTEFIALENPYTDDLSDGFDVSLFYQGEPRANAQVEIFSRIGKDGDVERTTVRTDQNGKATIPVEAGRTYLIDSVVMREPTLELEAEINVVWESLWASMTFEAPTALNQ